jgi:hypothetical protein
MISAEQPRNENIEAEINLEQSAEVQPEQILDNALATIESGDEQDPVISESWVKRHKKGLKTAGWIAGGVTAGPIIYGLVHLYPIVRFLKTLIEKKGKMTFGDGYKIAEDMFSHLGDKKSKG